MISVASSVIPKNLEDVTPDWLTNALRSSGAVDRARVVAIDLERVGGGYLGQYALLNLRYDFTETGAPVSMFLKLPLPDGALREFSVAAGLYRTEARFYESLASRLGVRVPRCYFSGFDDDSGDFAMLLEDLAPGGPEQFPWGRAVDDAEAIIVRLARMHAMWWESPELARYSWLSPVDSLREIIEPRYAGWLAACIRKVAHRDDRSLLHVGQRIGEHLDDILRMLSEHPQTLVHGDFWIANVLSTGESGNPLAFVDWQFVSRGRGALDAGYFMWSLPVSERRSRDASLLRTYHAELVANGVADYSFDDLWRDYRLSWLYSFILFVWTIADLDLSGAGGAGALAEFLDRIVAGVDELGSLDVLGA